MTARAADELAPPSAGGSRGYGTIAVLITGPRADMQSRYARYGFWLAIVCAVAALLSGIGYRLGWWPLRIGFDMLRYAAYGAIAATVIGTLGAIVTRPGTPRRGFAQALAAVVIGIATFAGPALALYRARSVPPIHDITTDTDNPPRFVSVLPLRAGAT